MAISSAMHTEQAKIHNENCYDETTNRNNSSTPLPKLSSSNRRVRFPEGDSIILGFLEPFHPTPDNCTSDELIAAYIASCKLYKTPPVDFLLEQLRGIDLSICNERYSRLCLRGIRLNRYQIETLEEVFRRVHFQEIDLEDTFLDEPSATALFDMMLHYETCVDLSISLSLERSNFSVAWSRCVTYLRKSGALQRFKLSHTPLTVNLFNGLSLSGLSLQSLTFRDCSLTGPSLHYFLRLLRFLMTYTANSSNTSSANSKGYSCTNANRYPRPSYRGPLAPVPWPLTLRLPENRINAVDAENLVLLVRHQLVMLPGPPTPTTSSDENLDSEATSSPTNKPAGGSGYLEELDVSHNNLRDDGVQILCAGLLQAYHLQHRRLEVALTTIAQAMNPNSDPVTTTVDTVNLPPKCALPRARGLQRLILADNGLGNNGGYGGAGKHLAAVLQCSTERLAPLLGGLTFLDLSDNPGLGDGGVVELCLGLIHNYTMKELYLRNVKMKFDGAFALSGYIGETQSLVTLDIRQNLINVAGIMAITRTLKENEMRQICLNELTEYLRRNRSIQLQPEPDCRQTAGNENDTISPKIQKAVERVSSPPMPDDINNRKNEDEEIKEILLDPPRLPGYVSPHGSVGLEDVPLDISAVATDSPFELQSIHLTAQLQNAVQSDFAASEKVDISKNQASNNQHSELTTEEIPDKEISVLKTVVEETSTLFQQEKQNPVEEVPIKSGNMDQVLEELTLPKNPTGDITFEGLGDEPPMEFEAFLKEHSEPTIETVNRKYGNPLESSPAEADESSVCHQGDFESLISQTHDNPIPSSVPDEKSSFQAVSLDSDQQEIIECDEFKDKSDIFATENNQLEGTNSPIAVKTSEPHLFQPEESLHSYKTSQPDEMISSEFNLESEDQIWREPHPNIEVKISADPELEIPNETSYLTSNPNTFNVMTTSQDKSSSEDLLKEVMQQYRNAEITSEMEDSLYNPVHPDDFIHGEVEVSESEDYLFNSLEHSPPKSTTKGVNVASGLEEHAEEELSSESCRNKEESGRTEGNFASEKERAEISSLHHKEILCAQGIVTEIECDDFVEHSVELKVKSRNTSVEQDPGSEIPARKTEQHGKKSFKETNGVIEENEDMNDETLCKNIANLENMKGLVVVGGSTFKVGGNKAEKIEEASTALTFGRSDNKMEEHNEERKTEVVSAKMEPGSSVPLSQDVFESNSGGSTSISHDDFIGNLSSGQLVDELMRFRSEATIGEEIREKKPMRIDYSLLQAIQVLDDETNVGKIPKSENLINSSTNEAKNVLASDTLSSSNGGKDNLLLISGWKTAGSGSVFEVLNEDIEDVEEQLKEAYENGAPEESSSEIIIQPLSEAANSVANIVSTEQSPVVVTEAFKIENNGIWSDFKETGVENPPVPPLDNIRFSDVNLEDAFPDSELTKLTPKYSNINDLTSFEKPETATFSLSDSDEEEVDQMQPRIEEMTPAGNKVSAIEPSLCSESNLAHYSKNRAYWTDFDQPGLEKYVPDSFNLQLEQPKKKHLIAHDNIEEKDGLDSKDPFTKPSSDFQMKEPVDCEASETDDGDNQGDAESSSFINQIGSQIDNLDLTTTINQENNNACPYSALTTLECKFDCEWDGDDLEMEQISQSEVPSNPRTIESDNEPSEWLNDIKRKIGESDRQESKQKAFKSLPKSEVKVQSEESFSTKEISSMETNREEEFESDPVDDGSQSEKLFELTVESNETNQWKTYDLSDISSNVQTSYSNKEDEILVKVGTETHFDLKVPLSGIKNSSKVETEVLDSNKIELEAEDIRKRDMNLNNLLSDSMTEHKTPPSEFMGYQDSESELTFVCEEDMKHDDFNFQAEFDVKKLAGTLENILKPKEADHWEINDWREEESANVFSSGAGARSQTVESVKNEVNLGNSTGSEHGNIFQVRLESLPALGEQANLKDTPAEDKLNHWDSEEMNNQDKFAVVPIVAELPTLDLKTEEISSLERSSEMLNAKRQSGDTLQSYLAFDSKVDSQQCKARNWDGVEGPEKTGFADFSPSIVEYQQQNDLATDEPSQ